MAGIERYRNHRIRGVQQNPEISKYSATPTFNSNFDFKLIFDQFPSFLVNSLTHRMALSSEPRPKKGTTTLYHLHVHLYREKHNLT